MEDTYLLIRMAYNSSRRDIPTELVNLVSRSHVMCLYAWMRVCGDVLFNKRTAKNITLS